MHTLDEIQPVQAVSHQQMDLFLSPLIMPVSKLDADQYMAEDIDGVTDNMFGSGNLNFLMLQAGQTNDSMQATQPFSLAGTDMALNSGMAAVTGFQSALDLSNNGNRYDSHDFSPGTDPQIAQGGSFHESATGGHAGFDAFKSASLTTTSLAADKGSANAFNGANGYNGESGHDGATPLNGTDGVDGTHGVNGVNGVDGQNGDGGTTIIDIDNVQNIDLSHIINLGDLTIDLGDFTLIDLGDVTNLITTSVTNITNITTTIIDNIFNTLGGDGLTLQLDGVLSQLTDLNLDLISGDTVLNLIDQAIDLSPVTDLLDPILGTDALDIAEVHSIFSILNGEEHAHHPGDMDLGLGVDTALGSLDVLNGVTDVIFNPVEDLAGDIDILADTNLDLFNTAHIDNGAGDTDLTLNLGVDLIDNQLLGGGLDIPLDPLESLTGDIDLDLGVATNLLGDVADNIVDHFAGGSAHETLLSDIGDQLGDGVGDLLGQGNAPDLAANNDISIFNQDIGQLDITQPLDALEPLTGDVELANNLGLDLFGSGQTDNAAGDSDLTADIDLNILGTHVADIDFIDVPLDPLESITGDIDLNLGAALDLLNPDAQDGGVADLNGGNANDGGILAWTENILPDTGDITGDAGLGALLPAPIGDIAEGLGGLLGGGSDASGGGLFGGHHGGGLFG